MSLINDLKKENINLKKKERELNKLIDSFRKEDFKKNKLIKELNSKLEKQKNENLNERMSVLNSVGKSISTLSDIAVGEINKNSKKYLICSESQGLNITEGREYLLVDEYYLKGQQIVEIIDNQNIVRKYNKNKFFLNQKKACS